MHFTIEQIVAGAPEAQSAFRRHMDVWNQHMGQFLGGRLVTDEQIRGYGWRPVGRPIVLPDGARYTTKVPPPGSLFEEAYRKAIAESHAMDEALMADLRGIYPNGGYSLGGISVPHSFALFWALMGLSGLNQFPRDTMYFFTDDGTTAWHELCLDDPKMRVVRIEYRAPEGLLEQVMAFLGRDDKIVAYKNVA